MSPSIAYLARAGVDEAKNNNIIEFLNRIYIRLEQWRHLKDSDDFSKERLAISRIVRFCKLVSMRNVPFLFIRYKQRIY